MKNTSSIFLAIILSILASYTTVKMTAPQNGVAPAAETKKETSA